MPFDPTTLIAPLPGETLASVAGKLGLAAILGAIIGAEREYRRQSAGLRTHMLMSLASAAFTMIAWGIYNDIQGQDGSPNVDPIRAVEAVTAGIAFLGAGAIIQNRESVHGLTTGAGMWTAGAIGVAVGCGYYSMAVTLVTIAIVVLAVLKWLTDHFTQDDGAWSKWDRFRAARNPSTRDGPGLGFARKQEG
jgi:putative Mg2+ transporter-C (MgtC) family protein